MKGAALPALLLLAASPPPAIEQLRRAARGGDPAAQYALGEAYRGGADLPADPERAILWYRRAAAKGHVGARDALGFALFAHGERREAMPYVEAAAARGDPRALYLLGTAHFNGDYAPRDWPLAFAQTSRAAEAGLPAATKNLTVMAQYLTSEDRARADLILATLPPVRRSAPPIPVPVPVAAPPPPPEPAPPPPVRSGGWRVQLGAFGTEAQARAAWTRLAARLPDLGAHEQIVSASGRVQRLQGGGFTAKAEADALCRVARARRIACFVLAP